LGEQQELAVCGDVIAIFISSRILYELLGFAGAGDGLANRLGRPAESLV
jgi:hypothetical protein